ncbi:hypothetical protein MESS4_620010 [Mesorhizobium sp. STM 4661]|nr:hypothetical protein MESS4_620010 [Mesorhizobium sp. STM 4661]
MALRHEYPQNLVFPERARAQGSDNGAVYAPGEADNHATTPQRAKDLPAQDFDDAIDLRASIEHQRAPAEF